jgi:MtN3 and saliva related transmembrane protein
MLIVNGIGILAGTGTTISFLPQVILTVRTGSVDNISPLMFIIHSSGVLSWIIYGVLIHNHIIILFNSIALLLNSILLVCIVRHYFSDGRDSEINVA